MRIHTILIVFLVVTVAVPLFQTASAQVPPPAPASPTLWSFLGIPQAYYKVHGAMFNRRGNFPGLESGPPMKGLANPENLESPFDAIKVAAEIKQAEDLAPQKIKGIKYLAKVGCGCYNREGDKVTKALVAGLNDCTESVRAATVEAIAEAAQDEMCQRCGQKSCCNEDITLELAKIAYERDEYGCYLEPSEEVRQAAVEALQICCPSQIPVEVIQEDNGGRTREPKVPLDEDPPPKVPRSLEGDDRTTFAEPGQMIRTVSGSGQYSSRRTWSGESSGRAAPASTDVDVPSVDLKTLHGVVERVHTRAGFATIHMDKAAHVPVGSKLNVYHDYLLGTKRVGVMEVVHTSDNTISARSIDRGPLAKVSRGDHVLVAQ